MMTWQNLLVMFEARSTRERLLIGATLLSVIWGLWMLTIGGSVIAYRVEVENNLDRLAQDLKTQTVNHQQTLQAWPDQLNLLQEKQGLEDDLTTVERQIQAVLGEAISPVEVAGLLKTVLAHHPGIELVELKNLPPVEVRVAEQPSGLYRHPVSVTVNGGYHDVLRYIEALEEIPRGMSFKRISYAVEEYPLARVVLEVESLSRHKAWLGV